MSRHPRHPRRLRVFAPAAQDLPVGTAWFDSLARPGRHLGGVSRNRRALARRAPVRWGLERRVRVCRALDRRARPVRRALVRWGLVRWGRDRPAPVRRALVRWALVCRAGPTIALLTGLLLVAGTSGAYTGLRTGSDAASTVAFTSAVAPLDCTSSADVSYLTVQYGTRINLVKRAGSDATVATGAVAAGAVAADTEPMNQDNEKGERLLAIIAAICVLGVTAAIIRAILAQRARGVVGT